MPVTHDLFFPGKRWGADESGRWRPEERSQKNQGETESHGIDFGAGFGDQFTYDTYVPEPDDTEDGDRPLSSDSDRPGETGSHGTDFGARFGDTFTCVPYAPAPDDTDDGDRQPSSGSIHLGGPGASKVLRLAFASVV